MFKFESRCSELNISHVALYVSSWKANLYDNLRVPLGWLVRKPARVALYRLCPSEGHLEYGYSCIPPHSSIIEVATRWRRGFCARLKMTYRWTHFFSRPRKAPRMQTSRRSLSSRFFSLRVLIRNRSQETTETSRRTGE